MKRYLIVCGPGAWGININEFEHDTREGATAYIERVAKNVYIFGYGGIHPAGWPYTTLHGTTSNVTVTGFYPSRVDVTLVATIYEIDVTEGQTAQQVFDTWIAEQDRIREQERQAKLEQAVQAALPKFPLIYEGDAAFVGLDCDEWEVPILELGEDNTIGNLIKFFSGIRSLPYIERVDLGRVRITIERVESANDDD